MRSPLGSDALCESSLRGDVGDSDARHLARLQRRGFIQPYIEIPLAPAMPGLPLFNDDFDVLIKKLPSKDKALIERDFLQPLKSLTDDWTMDKLVGPSRGGSARPWRVGKSMNMDETGCLNYIDCLFKLGVIFSGKSDDHVSRQCRPIECFSNSLDHPKKIVA